MVTVRRWYIFLVCIISLQSVAWAVITLLRNLLIGSGEGSVANTAFQIAFILIGLPVFLAHWLWAQNLAYKAAEERESALRRLYLYGTLAAFLGPLAVNTFELIANLLWLASGGKESRSYFDTSPTHAIISNLVAITVLALLWLYHQRIIAAEDKAAPEGESAAIVRRLYILGFSAAGVCATTLAIVNLLRWTMLQFGDRSSIGNLDTGSMTDEVARLAVGVSLWFIFWRWAQRLFTSPKEEERESALRKLYLYLIVYIASLATVVNITILMAGFFRQLLNLPSQGDIREPLSMIIGMAALWAYHSHILRGDATRAGEAPRQAAIRRLYHYLVAAVGLAAFLVGLSGDVSVLIRSLSERIFGDELKEQLAWFTAALIAGLPVWLWSWRLVQAEAVAADASGMSERHSIVRKIYLYFYLFVATMTVLSSAVYFVYRLLSVALNERDAGNLPADLGQAIAYFIIAAGAWFYHWVALRGDGQANRREQAKRIETIRVAVLDTGEGRLGRATLDGLQRELPGLTLDPIGLTQEAAQVMGGTSENIPAKLAQAGLIVVPWNVALAGGGVSAEIARSVVASPARKLLIPVRAEGWEWAGVDRWNAEAIVRQTVRAVTQIVEGEEVKPARPLGVGSIIIIIIVVYFLSNLALSLLSFIFMSL
jgi:hypothetical protein